MDAHIIRRRDELAEQAIEAELRPGARRSGRRAYFCWGFDAGLAEVKGWQAVADEQCRCFLIRAETAEKEVDRLRAEQIGHLQLVDGMGKEVERLTVALNHPTSERMGQLIRKRDELAKEVESLKSQNSDMTAMIYRWNKHVLPGECDSIDSMKKCWNDLEKEVGRLTDLADETGASRFYNYWMEAAKGRDFWKAECEKLAEACQQWEQNTDRISRGSYLISDALTAHEQAKKGRE